MAKLPKLRILTSADVLPEGVMPRFFEDDQPNAFLDLERSKRIIDDWFVQVEMVVNERIRAHDVTKSSLREANKVIAGLEGRIASLQAKLRAARKELRTIKPVKKKKARKARRR